LTPSRRGGVSCDLGIQRLVRKREAMDYIKAIFGDWMMLGGIILLVVLICVFFYLRSKKEDDD
jgi:hypothetical protein